MTQTVKISLKTVNLRQGNKQEMLQSFLDGSKGAKRGVKGWRALSEETDKKHKLQGKCRERRSTRSGWDLPTSTEMKLIIKGRFQRTYNDLSLKQKQTQDKTIFLKIK